MATPNAHAVGNSFGLAANARCRSVTPRTILIAGDNPVAQRLLKVVLAKRGHLVEIAVSSEQAISKLRETHFDFVLIDSHESPSEGMRFVKALFGRGTGDENRPSLIGLATDPDAASHAEERSVFDLLIAKPVDVVLLCEVIERFEAYTSWMPARAGVTPVLLSDALSPSEELRSSQRIRIAQGGAELTLSDGTKQACRVVDLSLGGAAVETSPKPTIGTQVTIGRANGRVTRHTANGIAVEFIKPISM